MHGVGRDRVTIVNAVHKHPQPRSNLSARPLFKYPDWAGTVENENNKNLEIRCMSMQR